jgi:hypothetical protein
LIGARYWNPGSRHIFQHGKDSAAFDHLNQGDGNNIRALVILKKVIVPPE